MNIKSKKTKKQLETEVTKLSKELLTMKEQFKTVKLDIEKLNISVKIQEESVIPKPIIPIKPKVPEVYNVRLATEEDITGLLQLSREAHEEGGLMPYSEFATNRDMIALVQQHQDHFMFVIGERGNPEACLLVQLCIPYGSEYPYIEQKTLYVAQKYRTSKRSETLIKFAITMAEDKKLPLRFGVSTGTRAKAKIRLMNKYFGEPCGSFYLYNGMYGYPKR